MDTANRNRMRDLLAGRAKGHGLPRDFYCDEAFHKLDLDLVFYREWLFAGHDCEIAAPGDYFTFDVGDHAAIVLRGRDGGIRAFHNVCRHRGARVCSQAKGRARTLVCPYHQWSYDLDGRLRFARDMGEDFDASGYGLKPVHCRSLHGMIFICLAEEAPDFNAFERDLGPYLAPHDLAGAKVAHESRIVEAGNWKLVFENNRECYHCPVGHPELTKTFIAAPYSTGQADSAESPEYVALWERCAKEAIPTDRRFAANGGYRGFRAALADPGSAMTLSGEPAVKRLLGNFQESRLGTGLLFHLPNTWNHLMADHVVSFRVTPLAPDRTELVTKWLVHRDAEEGRDYDLKTLTEVWLATNQQDCGFVELAQRGLRSPSYTPGPLSPVQEVGVNEFLDWYCGTMMEGLGGDGSVNQPVGGGLKSLGRVRAGEVRP